MQRLFHFSVQKSFVLIPESYPEMMLLGFQQFLVDFGEQYHHVIEEKKTTSLFNRQSELEENNFKPLTSN